MSTPGGGPFSGLTRGSDLSISKKTVSAKATPSIGSIATAPSSLDLKTTPVGGRLLDIPQSKLDLLDIDTNGTVEPSKVIVPDSSRSISGLQSIGTEELYVNGQKVEHPLPAGTVSNSPFLNSALPGKASANRALLSDSNASIGDINEISSSGLTLKNTTSDLEYTNYLRAAHVDRVVRFTRREAFSPGIHSTSIPSVGLRVITKVGSMYYGSMHYGMNTTSPAVLAGSQLEIGATYNSMLAYTNKLAASRTSTVNEYNVIYVDELSKYFIAHLGKGTGSSVTVNITQGADLTTATSATVATVSVSNYQSLLIVGLKWVPWLSKLVLVAYDNAGILIYTSSDGSAWSAPQTLTSPTPGILHVGDGEVWINTSGMIPSPSNTAWRSVDLTSWTSQSTNTSPNCPGVITAFDPVSKTYFMGGMNSQLFATNDFLTITQLSGGFGGLMGFPRIEGGFLWVTNWRGVYKCSADGLTLIKFVEGFVRLGSEYVLEHRHQASSFLTFAEDLPDTEVGPQRVINYTPNQYLDFEAVTTHGMYDFVYDNQAQGYYVIGQIGTTYESSPRAFCYFSKDLETFAQLGAPAVDCTGICTNHAGTLAAWAYGSSQIFHSTNGGVTWSYSSITAHNSGNIRDIKYSTAYGLWIITIEGGTNPTVAVTASISATTSPSFTGPVVASSFVTVGPNYHVESHAASAMDGEILPLPQIFRHGGAITSANYAPVCGLLTFQATYNRGTSITTVKQGTCGFTTSLGDASAWLTLTNSTMAGLVRRVPDQTYSDTQIGYGITANTWSNPMWFEPLGIFIAVASVSGNRNFTIAYSSDGIQWSYCRNARLGISSRGFNVFKYDERTGYLYMLTNSVPYRTKLSMLVNRVNPYTHVGDALAAPITNISSSTARDLKPSEFHTVTLANAGTSSSVKSIAYGYGSVAVLTDSKLFHFTSPYAINAIDVDGVSPSSLEYGIGKWALATANGVRVFPSLTDLTRLETTAVVPGSEFASAGCQWTSIAHVYSPGSQLMFIACGDNKACIISTSDGELTYAATILPLPPTTGGWLKVKCIGDVVFLLSDGKVAWANASALTLPGYQPLTTWQVKSLPGVHRDISVGKGIYLLASSTGIRTGTSIDSLATSLNASLLPTSPALRVIWSDIVSQFVILRPSNITLWNPYPCDGRDHSSSTQLQSTSIDLSIRGGIVRDVQLPSSQQGWADIAWLHRHGVFLMAPTPSPGGDVTVLTTNPITNGLATSLYSYTTNLTTTSTTPGTVTQAMNTNTAQPSLSLKHVDTMGQVVSCDLYPGAAAVARMVTSHTLDLSAKNGIVMGGRHILGSGDEISQLGAVAGVASAGKALLTNGTDSISQLGIKTGGLVINSTPYATSLQFPASAAGVATAQSSYVVGSDKALKGIRCIGVDEIDLGVSRVVLDSHATAPVNEVETSTLYPLVTGDTSIHAITSTIYSIEYIPDWDCYVLITSRGATTTGVQLVMYYSKDLLSWRATLPGLQTFVRLVGFRENMYYPSTLTVSDKSIVVCSTANLTDYRFYTNDTAVASATRLYHANTASGDVITCEYIGQNVSTIPTRLNKASTSISLKFGFGSGFNTTISTTSDTNITAASLKAYTVGRTVAHLTSTSFSVFDRSSGSPTATIQTGLTCTDMTMCYDSDVGAGICAVVLTSTGVVVFPGISTEPTAYSTTCIANRITMTIPEFTGKSITYISYNAKCRRFLAWGESNVLYSGVGNLSSWATLNTYDTIKGDPVLIKSLYNEGWLIRANTATNEWSPYVQITPELEVKFPLLATPTFSSGLAITTPGAPIRYAMTIAMQSSGWSASCPMKHAISKDGYNWQLSNPTPIQSANTASQSNFIVYSPELNMYLTNSGGILLTSQDCMSWTQRWTHPNSSMSAGIWVSQWGLFICTASRAPTATSGQSYPQVVSSNNGVDWQGVNLPGANSLGMLAYSPTLNRIVAASSQVATQPHNDQFGWYSNNGQTWFKSTATLPGSAFYVGGMYLRWLDSRQCFSMVTYPYNMPSTAAYPAAWITSKDGITWENAVVYQPDSRWNVPITKEITTVPGLGDVFVSSSPQGTAEESSLCVLTDRGAARHIALPYRWQTSTNNISHLDRILYNPSLNQVLLYKSVPSSVREATVVLDLDVAIERPSVDLRLDEVAAICSAPSPSQSLEKWIVRPVTGASFTGKIRWLPNKSCLVATCGDVSLAASNQYHISADGYTWTKPTHVTTADQTPANTLVNDVVACAGSEYIFASQSNGVKPFSITSATTPFMGAVAAASNMLSAVANSGRIKYITKLKAIVGQVAGGSVTTLNYTQTGQSIAGLVKAKGVITFPTYIDVGCYLDAPELMAGGVMAAFAKSGATFYYIAQNGVQAGTFPVSANCTEAAYSPTLGVTVVVTQAHGIFWTKTFPTGWTNVQGTSGIAFSDVIWVPELGAFVTTVNQTSITPIYYSTNGTNWTSYMHTAGVRAYSVAWSSTLGSLFLACGSSLLVSNPALSRPGSRLKLFSSLYNVGNVAGELYPTSNGLIVGTTGNTLNTAAIDTQQLTLQEDSTFKPSTSTWTVSSDVRLKENIQPADLDRCVEIVKSIPLKKFKWVDSYIQAMQIPENKKEKVGWIAQDVEKHLPNSITTMSLAHVAVDDFKQLNSDQLIAVLHGAIQRLSQRLKSVDKQLDIST